MASLSMTTITVAVATLAMLTEYIKAPEVYIIVNDKFWIAFLTFYYVDGDRLGFPGELSYQGEFSGYLTGQDYPRGRIGFGAQERTVTEHDYRESVPRTEAPRIGIKRIASKYE